MVAPTFSLWLRFCHLCYLIVPKHKYQRLMLTNSTRQSADKCHTYDLTQPLHAQGCYNFDFNNTNFLNETNGTAVQKVPLNLLKWFCYSVFVAFCSFFPCSLTFFHRGRKQKSGGRQQKSSRADKQDCFP